MDTATVAASTVDLGPLITAVITFVGGVVSLLGGFAINYITKKLKLSGVVKDDTIRRYFTDAVGMGVHFAVSRLATADWTKVDTKNEAIATAVNYALEHVPDALKYFGVDGEQLSKMVEARLAAAYPDLVLSAKGSLPEPGVA
jgi:hypothetical protein